MVTVPYESSAMYMLLGAGYVLSRITFDGKAIMTKE